MFELELEYQIEKVLNIPDEKTPIKKEKQIQEKTFRSIFFSKNTQRSKHLSMGKSDKCAYSESQISLNLSSVVTWLGFFCVLQEETTTVTAILDPREKEKRVLIEKKNEKESVFPPVYYLVICSTICSTKRTNFTRIQRRSLFHIYLYVYIYTHTHITYICIYIRACISLRR